MPSSTTARKTKQHKGFLTLMRSVARCAEKGRDELPWRTRRTPYRVFVSEIMLQQTQVERVIPKFNAFLSRFPDWQALASASLADVLTLWIGLGYNRRAKALHQSARTVVARFDGKLPRDPALIRELPGVGPYTAAAVAAFAFDMPTIFIETNIRTVFLHHCFAGKQKVCDTDILPLVARSLAGKKPSVWYAALMDYGSQLKHGGVRLNAQSAQHAKQSAFEGSARQLRGAIVRLVLAEQEMSVRDMARQLKKPQRDVRREALRLQKEGLIRFSASALSGSRVS